MTALNYTKGFQEFHHRNKCMYIFKIVNNLFHFVCICYEECYVDQLKDSTNQIDTQNQYIVGRYEGCAIPHAEQAIQESIYIWQP
jgi:hypothetical protein